MLKKQLIHVALNYPRTVYLVMVLLVVICTAMLPLVTIDTDPENMLAEDEPARVFHNQIKQLFTMHDMIVVGAVNQNSIYNPTSLEALTKLSNDILLLDAVIRQEQMALNTVDNITHAGKGTIRFEWLMKEAPTTQAQADSIRKAILRLPMLENTVVSGDSKAAAIYVPITSKDLSYRTAESIRSLIQSLDSNDEYFITGLPVAEDQFGVEMFVQMGIAAPLAGLAIFLLMWLFFRSIPLITGPMVVAIATVLIVMGLLIGMGYTVHILSSMIAIFLMPIAVVDSTHILSEFADRFRPGEDAREIITRVMEHLFTPMLYTSVTSAVGFLSLMLTPIPPVKIFGAFVGFGIFLAFLLTVFFIPAYISRMNPKTLEAMQTAVHRIDDGGWLGCLLPRMGKLTVRHSRLIVLFFASLFAISLWGVTKIQINDNPVKWFKADHEIRIADQVLNHHFAGTYDAWLVIQPAADSEKRVRKDFIQAFNALAKQAKVDGVELEHFIRSWPDQDSQAFSNRLNQLVTQLDDHLFEATDTEAIWLEKVLTLADNTRSSQQFFQSPTVLQWMAELQQALVDSGLVGKVNALPDIVKTVNRELHNGMDADFRLPATSNAVAQTLLQYQSSHRPQDLWHFVTPDYRQSLMWLQLTSGDNFHMSRIIDFVNQFVEKHPLPEGLTTQWAGKTYLNVVWQDAMVSGMLNSLMSSFIVVFLIMTLLFRSIKYGVLAMLPLTFTIMLIYGLIGWTGKDYDMPIAVLSALALGLSVDFAIHFLERIQDIHKQTGSVSTALTDIFQEPARAISRNAIVIAVGFTPLLFAPLVPYITVGVFLASIMTVSALVTLLLLPALLSSAGSFIFRG